MNRQGPGRANKKVNSDKFRKETTMTTKRLWAAGLAAVMIALTLLVLGLSNIAANAQQAPPAANEIRIDNFTFGPETTTVPVGTTVTWTNRDDIPHTVVSTDKAFKSKVLDTDEKFSSTFSKAGVFEYFCSIHPKMTGKIVVK
jgi:plastocyanin